MTYLKNERIQLRAIEMSDAETLHRWENDTSSWASSMTIQPLSSELIRSYITDSAHSIITKGELMLIIIERSSGSPVGYLQLLGYDALSRRTGLGLYLSPEHRGRGYATEALGLVKSYAFDCLGLRMLYADILASNEACWRIFERLGYQHTATLPEWHYAEGKWHDLRYYQLWNQQ